MLWCILPHETLTEKCPLIKADRYSHRQEDEKGAGKATRARFSCPCVIVGKLSTLGGRMFLICKMH